MLKLIGHGMTTVVLGAHNVVRATPNDKNESMQERLSKVHQLASDGGGRPDLAAC